MVKKDETKPAQPRSVVESIKERGDYLVELLSLWSESVAIKTGGSASVHSIALIQGVTTINFRVIGDEAPTGDDIYKLALPTDVGALPESRIVNSPKLIV